MKPLLLAGGAGAPLKRKPKSKRAIAVEALDTFLAIEALSASDRIAITAARRRLTSSSSAEVQDRPRAVHWLKNSNGAALLKMRGKLRALARRFGVSASEISRVANGERPCSLWLAHRLEDELQIDTREWERSAVPLTHVNTAPCDNEIETKRVDDDAA